MGEVQRNEKAKQIKKNHSKLRTNKLLNNIFSCLEEEPTLEGCNETIEFEVPNMLKKQKNNKKKGEKLTLNYKIPSDEHWYYKFKKCYACYKSHFPRETSKYCRWAKNRRDIQNEFTPKNKKKIRTSNENQDEETIQLIRDNLEGINNRIEQLQVKTKNLESELKEEHSEDNLEGINNRIEQLQDKTKNLESELKEEHSENTPSKFT